MRTLAGAQEIVDQIYLGEIEIPARGRALVERALGEVEIRLASSVAVLPAVEA